MEGIFLCSLFTTCVLCLCGFVLIEIDGKTVDADDRSANEIPEDVSMLSSETTTGHPLKDPSPKAHINVIKPTPVDPKSAKKSGDTLDPMDKYILDGILKIVDEKFSAFDKRLMMMERGVSNLQYYNVRNFRVVNTHLHAVDNILHGIHTEIDHVQGKQKDSEQSIQSVKKEVVDLQSLNSGMFQAIEQNLVHFHEDMQSRLAELKEGLDQSNARTDEVRNQTFGIRENMHDVKRTQQMVLQNTEASVILASQNDMVLTSLSNKSDEILGLTVNTEENSLETLNSVQSIMNKVHSVGEVTGTIHAEITTILSNFTSLPNLQPSVDSRDIEREDKSEYNELRAPKTNTYMSCGKMLQIIDQKLKHINVTHAVHQPRNSPCQSNSQWPQEFKGQSKKLLRALSTVNDNIFQSVTLYRHTGNLIERVISDTELIAAEQGRLRQDLVALLLNGTMDLFNQSYPDIAEFVDFTAKPTSSEETSKYFPASDDVQRVSTNTTELVEILTKLVSTSTVSINSSLVKLDKKIARMNKVQEDTLSAFATNKADLFALDDPKAGSGNSQLREIQNRTELIFTLVEAIASNTGWIPYFFHNMRFVEAQVNKTLKQMHELNAKTDDIVVGQRASMSLLLKPAFIPNKQTTPIPSAAPLESLKTAKPPILQNGQIMQDVDLTNESIAMGEQMTFVYETNLKLNRLIPALTNLLGEPEPYIALVDGANDREGRVEIYHKGVWGTIGQNIGHIEAAYICRKLGHLGGISAGNGHFGPGSGAFWNLNVTCLQTRWCDSVSHVIDQKTYRHESDAGVICDHMLRLNPTDDDTDGIRNSGRLEIYHQNSWHPICFKGWGRKETSIACNQLGFREGAATAVKNDSLANHSWMTQVTCSGSYTRLDACDHGFELNGCKDNRHVSVICS